MLTDDVAKLFAITAIAPEGLHQHGKARLMLDKQLQHDLVEVRPMVPAVPPRAVNNLFRELLIAVIAPIDRKARAIEMGKTGRKAQMVGSGSGYEAVEFRHPKGIGGIQGAAKGIIVELCGGHTG
jgi:hypothetical protein